MEKGLCKVLLLEDSKTDQVLIKRQVLQFSPTSLIVIANDRSSFLEKLEWTTPDIILSDFDLLDFNGLEALLHVKEFYPNIPFVFITGALNDEEKAAETILKGASGYLLKNNMNQLPMLMEQVLANADATLSAKKKKERALAEQRFLLQKVHHHISQAPGFAGREETIQILEDLVNAPVGIL